MTNPPHVFISDTGILRMDGIPVCKIILGEKIMLEFKDPDRLRSNCRGSCFVTISLEEFVEKIQVLNEQHLAGSSHQE